MRRIVVLLSVVVGLLMVSVPAHAGPEDVVACLLHWANC